MIRHAPPSQSTPIIGREAELADVTGRLSDSACRLLTIIGPGGVGKTRLALEAAAGADEQFAVGAFFVDLQAAEASTFTVALADALPLALSGRQQPQAQLFKYLRDKDILLLLDNFEHLLSKATLLSELLAEAPGVRLLVTSREALNLQQEWLYPLRGLPIPPTLSVNDLGRYGAVALFEERARRVRPDFALAEERQAVVRICRLVEGLPLALELAASWTRTLACAEIADEIEQNLAFLSRPLRDMPERHRSMQAVFDQMWALVPEEERRVFRRLSLFRGGFQREAAEAVAGATLSVLAVLVDKCMVRRDGRYYVHELLRQFGEEKLQAAPEEAERVCRRHVEYYTTFLHRRLEQLQTVTQRQAAMEIAEEWDNVRAAWRQAVAKGNVEAIRRAAGTLHHFCQLRSRFLEGATALEAAVTRVQQEPASGERDLLLAELFNHEGWLRIRVGDFERARRILTQSCALFEALAATPPPYMGSDSAVPLSTIALIGGDAERAAALCEAARRSAAERGDKQNLAFAHYGLASARAAQGNYEAAYRHAEQACIVAREAGNRWFLTYPLIEWGNVARAMGNYDEAERHYRAAYALKEEFEAPEGMAVTLSRLGEIALQQERYGDAVNLFRQSLNIYHDLNDRGGLATCYTGLGQVAHATEDFQDAGEHFHQALQIAAEIEFWPLICAIIVDVAALLGSLNRPVVASSLLKLVQQHPSTRHETRHQAQRQLAVYKSQLEAEAFAMALRQGDEWQVEQALATVYSELAAIAKGGSELVEREQPLADPLTDRELDVLRLLGRGYTNAEIAEELVLARGTVKWYASQIYGKLGVSNRTQAAARARKLDLIPG